MSTESHTSSHSGYTRQALYRVLTPAFVHDSLRGIAPTITQTELAIVRCIVLRNIVSKTIAGKLSRDKKQPRKNIAIWLRDYCRTVYGYRRSTQPWLGHLLMIENGEALYDRIGDAVGNLFSANYFLKVGMQQEEPVQQVFVDLHNGKLFYPYDMPFDAWLKKVCANWVHHSLRSASNVARVEDLDDEYGGIRVAESHSWCEETDVRLWDARIDLDRFQQRVSRIDAEILRLYRRGHDRSEIAAQLKLSVKAISNRLSLLRNALTPGDSTCKNKLEAG